MTVPASDVLAEEYRGRYLWAEIRRLRAQVQQLKQLADEANEAYSNMSRIRAREMVAADAEVQQLRGTLDGPIRENLVEAGREIHSRSDHPERIDWEAALRFIDAAIGAARAALARTPGKEGTG